MEEALRALIVGDPDVSALVPAASVAWSSRKGLPAITLHLVWGPKPKVTHDGPSGLEESTVQVNCEASTVAEATRIRRAVSRLLSAYGDDAVLNRIFVEGGGSDDEEAEGPVAADQPAKFRNRRLDLRVWHVSP